MVDFLVCTIKMKVDFSKAKKRLTLKLESYKEKYEVRLQEYAMYVEYGTRPHYVPAWVVKEKLIPWIMIKNGLSGKYAKDAAWAVAYKIEQEGTKPHPFIRPAIYFAQKETPRILKEGGTMYDVALLLKQEMQDNLVTNNSIATMDLYELIDIVPIWKRKGT